MVLNALNMKPPISPQHAPYKIFDQDNIFYNKQVLHVITPAKVQYQGATLDQITQVIKVHAPNTVRYYASNSSVNAFRKLAISVLRSKNKAIVINFCRKNIGEIGCGHFSPLAAYNRQEDRFLLLDVARYKYPPVWVKTKSLFSSMDTIDSTSKKTRGYIVVTT